MANKRIRDLINLANAQDAQPVRHYPRDRDSQRSASGQGPRSWKGKQRSKLNAFKHNLSGQHLVLVEHEFVAYEGACERGLRDMKPKTEMERQIAQKIIDLNFRLNRITSLESNMFNLDTSHNETDMYPDDRR